MKRLFLALIMVIGLVLGCVGVNTTPVAPTPVVEPQCQPKALLEKEFSFVEDGVEYRVMFVDADCDGACDVAGLFQVVQKDRGGDRNKDLVTLIDRGACEEADEFVAEVKRQEKLKKGY